MPLTRERIESMAPDQASLSAALKLQKPSAWPLLAATADAAILWGECQGSGSQPYRVVVAPDEAAYKCTCPSRKFPCKHVLAVLWMRVETPARFVANDAPPWVQDWMGRRKTGAPKGKPDDGTAPKAAPSLDAAIAAEAEPEKTADPKVAARAEAQRQRLKAERELAILDGLGDLDRWVTDQLGQGLAGFAARAQASARTLSARLVDAKAAGLASRLDRLVSELFRVGEERRADLAIERLAALALIASAYRHQDALPPLLRDDVRRQIGWSQKREELLADPTAPRRATTWIVAANLAEVQPDKLRRLETWLVDAMPTDGAPMFAVMMDFVPVAGGGAGFPFAPGESVTGEVVFYPSPAPLRGLLASRTPGGPATVWPPAPIGVCAAMDRYTAALARVPWLEAWPITLQGVQLRSAGKARLMLADTEQRTLPIERGQIEVLTPLLGLDVLSVFALWDGHAARVLAADTPIGLWHGE